MINSFIISLTETPKFHSIPWNSRNEHHFWHWTRVLFTYIPHYKQPYAFRVNLKKSKWLSGASVLGNCLKSDNCRLLELEGTLAVSSQNRSQRSWEKAQQPSSSLFRMQGRAPAPWCYPGQQFFTFPFSYWSPQSLGNFNYPMESIN